MDNTLPTWAEITKAALRSSSLSLTGTLTYRYVRHDGSVDVGVHEFWHAPGDRWRIERDGSPLYIRNGATAFAHKGSTMRRHPVERTQIESLLPISPLQLVGGTASLVANLSPDVEVTVVGPDTVDNRSTWTVRLGSGEQRSELEFDQETGVLVRLSSPQGPLSAHVTGLTADRRAPESTFEWDGPTDDPPLIEVVTADLMHQLRQMNIETPRYWPTGLGYSPMTGDPNTGELVVSLEVEDYPLLARWPLNTQLTSLDARATAGHTFTTDWSDAQWHWRLYSRMPIADDDLARIQASMTRSEPH